MGLAYFGKHRISLIHSCYPCSIKTSALLQNSRSTQSRIYRLVLDVQKSIHQPFGIARDPTSDAHAKTLPPDAKEMQCGSTMLVGI
jgi:hypothetical protein